MGVCPIYLLFSNSSARYLYIIRSNYLQKVAIIVLGCSNYGIYQIQNTWLNMKCLLECVLWVWYVCKWYIIKNEPFDEWWWRFKWSGLFFICLQIMNVYFFRHASGFISMIIKRWKLLRWKTWNSHLLHIIRERKLLAFDLEVKVT
jgi:hypothetical protein